MRNIFDQYVQPENRVTHALFTALNEDKGLLKSFLKDVVHTQPPDLKHLSILEQQYPGEEEPLSEDESERRGIPDGWIYDDEGWCIFVESKVLGPIRGEQIARHRRTAERRGFKQITAVAIAPRRPRAIPADTVFLEWREIYAWLKRRAAEHPWAERAARFFEVAEGRFVATEQFREGTLTMFSGFPFGFDRPFTYLEGKRVLRLALDELKQSKQLRDELGMDPSRPGRPAITGRQEDRVWDFLRIGGAGGNFTNFPHLTLGLTSDGVDVMVTVPHAVETPVRRNLIELGLPGFQALVEDVVERMSPMLREHSGVSPRFRGVQRRYPTQRAVPFMDALIEFDLRTAVSAGGPPKEQPRWLEAAYGTFVDKRGANFQIQIGAVFPYERCPDVADAGAIKLIENTWLSCKPLIDLARSPRAGS